MQKNWKQIFLLLAFKCEEHIFVPYLPYRGRKIFIMEVIK